MISLEFRHSGSGEHYHVAIVKLMGNVMLFSLSLMCFVNLLLLPLSFIPANKAKVVKLTFLAEEKLFRLCVLWGASMYGLAPLHRKQAARWRLTTMVCAYNMYVSCRYARM